LSKRIVRVIDIQKLSKKYKTYEAQRQLRESAEIILADDRIITRLPKVLGKTFYGTTKYRPIPVSLAAVPERVDGKRVAGADRASDRAKAGTAKEIAVEIQKAVDSTLVHLSPSTNTSVKVGLATWEPEKVVANVKVVTERLIEKFVTKGWRGVRSVHIKGPETVALPIWLASELWTEEGDVLDEGGVKKVVEANTSKKRKNAALAASEEKEEPSKKKGKKESKKSSEQTTDEPTNKRKADSSLEELVASTGATKEKKSKKPKTESNDDKLDAEIALRKATLKKQKADAAVPAEDEVPRPTKKAKKAKKEVVAA